VKEWVGTMKNRIDVCAHCDSVVQLTAGHHLKCPTCGAVLQRIPNHFPLASLIFAVCGLLMFIPANTLALMTFEFVGRSSTNTMFNGASYLFGDGYWWMAFLVMMCSVVMPFLDLMFMALVCGGLLLPNPPQWLLYPLRWQAFVKEWSMLEVYLIGLLIAYIRMMDMGDVHIGMGFVCFVLVIVSIVLSHYHYSSELAFRLWERKRA